MLIAGAVAQADTNTAAAGEKGAKGTQLAQAATSESDTVEQLRAEIEAEKARTAALEKRLDELESTEHQQSSFLSTLHTRLDRGAEITPGAGNANTEADIYNKGFFLQSKTGKFSLYINGLAQVRYTLFKANSVSQFGANNPAISNFDLFLGRVAFSGNVFEPDLKYFFQVQGSTAGNSNGISLLDWFMSKTVNPYLTVQAGRSWTFYTYEYYDNPGNYLFPDLSSAEYAFLLQRAIGLQVSGQAGRLGYGAEVANSVPALDAGGQENLQGQMAYIGNIHYDLLAPYGWIESEPTEAGAAHPELTLWASGMYNPVDYASTFQNVEPGDRTFGSTANVNFRYRYFTFQGSGYYRRTIQHTGLPSYDLVGIRGAGRLLSGAGNLGTG
jgi:hypothetical protein